MEAREQDNVRDLMEKFLERLNQTGKYQLSMG